MLDETWVSASDVRNYFANDTLLDWLQLYGEAQGFRPDNKREGYNSEVEFTLFMKEKGTAFEREVIRCLADRGVHVVQIPTPPSDNLELTRAQDPRVQEATVEAMASGAEVIYQGVLHDHEHKTYACIDLMVRKDVLSRLVDGAVPLDACDVNLNLPPVEVQPSSLGHDYRIVDIKFRTLDIGAKGWATGIDDHLKAQLQIYNRALGSVMGYEPQIAYLLGRRWRTKRTIKGTSQTELGSGCLERLAPVCMSELSVDELESACAWVRRVRSEGANWRLDPRPSVPELWPNMKNTQDFPWHHAKKEISSELRDLTLLWQAKLKSVQELRTAGVTSYDHPELTAGALGVGVGIAKTLDAIIAANRDASSPLVSPEGVQAALQDWSQPEELEFFVDFEFSTASNDDFAKMPQYGASSLIFMIGCLHIEGGEPRFHIFTVDEFTEAEEGRIIREWLRHMRQTQLRLNADVGRPKVYHWSRAEPAKLTEDTDAALARHPEVMNAAVNWFDFLKQVVRAEPVVVRGAFGFGLKAVAKALYSHGLIGTHWPDGGVGDGLNAMVAAWRAGAAGGKASDHSLMLAVADYNKIDCMAMYEIITYLRQHHVAKPAVEANV